MKRALGHGVRRAWGSPTIATWASFAVRSAGMLVVLPLIGAKWSAGDIAFWLLLSNVVGLLMMVLFGFDSTFSRLISYARAGLSPEAMGDLREMPPESARTHAVTSLARVIPTQRTVFLIVAGLGLLLAIGVGAVAIGESARATSDPQLAWTAWWIVCAGIGIGLYGGSYSSFMVGANEVALIRRWEAIFGIAQIALLIGAVSFGVKVFGAVMLSQSMQVIGVIRNGWLARQILDGTYARGPWIALDRAVWRAAWPAAWRQGLTQLLALGVMQASGLMYSLVAESRQLASYLLCLRLSQVLQQVSVAPFMSRLPSLAAARAQGDREGLIQSARTGMRRAYVVFLFGVVGIGLFGNMVFDMFGRGSLRVDGMIWHTFAVAIAMHVWGGMHSGLYNLTNRLFSHLTAIAFAIVYLVVALSTVKSLGAIAFAFATIAAQAVAMGHVGHHTYRAMGTTALVFEQRVGGPAAAVLLLYLALWWGVSAVYH